MGKARKKNESRRAAVEIIQGPQNGVAFTKAQRGSARVHVVIREERKDGG